MARVRDLTGQRFGRLTAVELCGVKPAKWRCSCDCGGEAEVAARDLVKGHTASCGCWGRESRRLRVKHGHARRGARSALYTAWKHMIARCYNPNDEKYESYGGRGIEVCRDWHTFKNFAADMGEPPSGLSLERKNNNGNYEPGNVKWATRREQARNTRTFHGRRTPTCHPDRPHEAKGLCKACYWAAWASRRASRPS